MTKAVHLLPACDKYSSKFIEFAQECFVKEEHVYYCTTTLSKNFSEERLDGKVKSLVSYFLFLVKNRKHHLIFHSYFLKFDVLVITALVSFFANKIHWIIWGGGFISAFSFKKKCQVLL